MHTISCYSCNIAGCNFEVPVCRCTDIAYLYRTYVVHHTKRA